MPEKRYVLDLTNAKLPSWWPENGPVILPIEPSKHQYDWDLIPSLLPSDFYTELVQIIKKRFLAEGRTGKEEWPIGFRNNTWPRGGIIRTV